MQKVKLEMFNMTYKELLQKLGIPGNVYDLTPAEDGVRLIVIVNKKK